MPSRQGLTIGQVAQRTGLATSAIRYYEDMRLVFPFRNDAGQRRFASADIRRLSFVMVSQSLGFSIADIRRTMASLPKDHAPSKADWSKISKRFGSELDQRIAKMQLLRERLDGCIGCGCLSLKNCALYNKGDAAAKSGPGPRHLMVSD